MFQGKGKVSAIVPAAGTSTRMGHVLPKPLIEIAGESIIERTLASLDQSGVIDDVTLLVPKEFLAVFLEVAKEHKHVSVIVGGATRQDSVRIGVESFADKATKPEIVLIHDAARCLITPELIASAVSQAKLLGAITLAVPVVDSIAEVDATAASGKKLLGSLDRSKLWAVQTPQVFKYDLIQKAHEHGRAGATDDASLVSPHAQVYIEPGDVTNIKVTTPMDLIIAEQIIRGRSK